LKLKIDRVPGRLTRVPGYITTAQPILTTYAAGSDAATDSASFRAQLPSRRVAVFLPEDREERVLAFPETGYGVHMVTVTLADGQVFPGST
jgi:hypothetical protein